MMSFVGAHVLLGGDALNLRDLLVGEAKAGQEAGNLDQFLDFDTAGSPGSTVIRISSSGGFTAGTYSEGAEDQRIILQGVDLRSAAAFGLNPSASDNDIIQQLLQRGKLVTDGP
jgi:large repetitive protein